MSSGVTLWPHPTSTFCTDCRQSRSKRCIKARSESSNDIKSWTKTPWRTASGAIELPVATQFFCWGVPSIFWGKSLADSKLRFHFDRFWQILTIRFWEGSASTASSYEVLHMRFAQCCTYRYFYTTCIYKYCVYILSYTIIQNNRNTHCWLPGFEFWQVSCLCGLPLELWMPPAVLVLSCKAQGTARVERMAGRIGSWGNSEPAKHCKTMQKRCKMMQKSSNAQSWFSWCGK